MVAPRSLFQLLTEALQESRPGMAPDDPAAIARRYPQSGVSNSSNAEAQTRFPPPVDVPPREERRLSLARFAAEAQASPQDAGYAGTYGARPSMPWWVAANAPALPVRGGRFGLPRYGGLGGPMPPPSPSGSSNIPMPEIPEAWKIYGPMLMLYPELLQERLVGERGESKEGDTGPTQFLELYQKSLRGSRSKTWRDATRAFNKRHYDMCDQQKAEEEKRCFEAIDQHPDRNYSESPYRDWLHGCRTRAEDRRTICRKTGTIPAQPAEWGPLDEEN